MDRDDPTVQSNLGRAITYSVESVWQAERVWFGMRTPVGRTAFQEGVCAVNSTDRIMEPFRILKELAESLTRS